MLLHEKICFCYLCFNSWLSLFQFLGEEPVNGLTCEKWRLVDTKGTKVNKYTMWIRYKASVSASSYRGSFISFVLTHCILSFQ
jgi:hypothetical protein